MISVREGPHRHLARLVVMTVAWGVVFGLIDSNIDTLGNWAYALFVGAVFTVMMLGVERWEQRKRNRDSGV